MTDQENTILQLCENYWTSRIFDISQFPHNFQNVSPAVPAAINLDLSTADLQVDKIARGNAWGKFSIYTALFAVVLQRFFYVDELLIATPVVSGALEGDDRLLFLKLSSPSSLKVAIQQLQQDLQKSIGYEKYRFEKLVERLGEGSPALALTQAFGIAYQGISQPSALFGEQHITLEILTELNASAVLKADGTICDAELLTAIAAAFMQLAEDFAGLLSTPLEEVSLGPLVLPAPAVPVSGEAMLLHALFEKQAAVTPAANALLYNGNVYTYNQVDDKASLLAAYLTGTMQVKQGDRVAFVMERSDRMIIALLAILKAGATYVPVDPEYPAAFKDRILADVQPACLLLDDATSLTPAMEGLRQLFVTDVLLDHLTIPLTTTAPVRGGDTAYIIYTSGSTGVPKGVMIRHDAAVNYLQGFSDQHKLEGADYLLVSSIAFDASLRQVFLPFMSGHAVHLLKSARDGAAVIRYCLLHCITTLSCSPSFYRNLLQHDTFAHLSATLTLLILGGERLDRKLAGTIRTFSPQAKLINAYGPTEVTVNALTAVVNDNSNEIPVGIPLPGYTAYILDRYLHPLPVGAMGEICVAGAGLAKGYLNQEQATSEKFISHKAIGATIYRTGDWGRLLADGNIYFLGRMDTQVKIRGYRVECDAVAAALLQAGAQQAIVMPVADTADEPYLAAYITGVSQQALTDVKEKMATLLPAYMLPSAYIRLDYFPVNTNGKTDLTQLPHPRERKEDKQPFLPENEMQGKLGSIWREVLERDDFTADDVFFELGGHSLSATQVLARIHKHIRTDVSLADMFRYKTIRQQERMLQQVAAAAYTPIPLLAAAAYYQLSHGQKRLWLLDHIEEDLVQYNMVNTYVLKGNVNMSTLSQAWNLLTDRYEILRTVFRNVDGAPAQFVLDNSQAGVLAYHDRIVDVQEVDTLIVSESNFHFDLSTGPLTRAQVLKVDERSCVLILNIHHIISDQWSQRLMMQTLSDYYDALLQNKNYKPAPLQIQYKDYSHWQLENLEQPAALVHSGFWQQQLQQDLPVLEMPLDYPRPAKKTYAGRTINKTFPGTMFARLQALSRQEDASLFMVLLSVFNVLLNKYTGQQDLITGTPVSGRDHIDLEDQLGFFINMIPVRVSVDRAESFSTLLGGVKKNLLEAYKHAAYPFDKVVEDLQLARDDSRSAVFDVVFQFTTEPKEAELHHDFSVQSYHTDTNASVFDLILHVVEREDDSILQLTYNTRLFSEQSMQRFADQFLQLAAEITLQPAKPLYRLAGMDAIEREKVLHTFNATAVAYPKGESLGDLFTAQAVATPSQTALVCEDRTWTYRQLEDTANRMAAYLLHECNVQPGDLIGLVTSRSDNAVAWILAIIKAGAAYLPVDTAYPAERIDYMLEDAGVKLLVTGQEMQFAEGIRALPLHDTAIDTYRVDTLPHVASGYVAYMMYTSGSTGKPKGVKVSHGNVARLVKSNSFITPGVTDRLLLTGSLAFDATTFEIWGPLLNGGQLHILPDVQLMDPVALKATMEAAAITMMWFTVSWFNQLVDTDLTLFAGLHALIVGGDRLSVKHIRKLKSTYPYIRIINGYGPTEGTTFTTCHLIVDADLESGTIPIGKPLPNTRVYILDDQLAPLPIGMPGEICIAGDGVALGYHHDPRLSEQKFMPDPFYPGDRMYRSGDTGRWLEDGSIAFIGRKDTQVKIRGYRVECSEIENAIQQAGIKDCVVIPVKDPLSDSNYLVAYIVKTEGITIDGIKASLQHILPTHMMPAAFMTLEQIPLTTQGKTDKRKLPAPELLQQSRIFIKPRTATEEILSGIWQNLLNCGPVSISDNFFDLGGHSLLAMRLIAAVRTTLQKDITIRSVFAHPTIEALSNLLQATASGSALVPLVKQTESDRIPLSFGQERLWFINKLDGSTQYHISFCYRLKGTVDKTLLEKSFRTIVDRHASLRTLIREYDGVPFQEVQATGKWQMQTESLQYADAAALQAHVAALVASPFRLFADHMLRVHLLELGNGEHLLVAVLHHIASDGWSNAILVKELAALYTSLENGQEAGLLPLPVQYTDFAIWQRSIFKETFFAAQLAYWKQQLTGTATLELPLDFARPAIQSNQGDIFHFTLDAALATALRGLARQENTTLFITLLAAFKVLLYRYSGQEDLCIGTPVAGRTRQETEGLIGCFINMLALRTHLDGNPAFTTLLKNVTQTTLQAFDMQDIPFEKIVDAVATTRDLSRSPLFQVMFVLHNTPEVVALELGAIAVEAVSLPQVTTQYDLTFSLEETGAGLTGSIVYNKALFRDTTIARMAGHFNNLLQAIVAAPETTIGLLPLMDAAQIQTLEKLSQGASLPIQEDTFVNLLQEQVLRTSSDVALVFDDTELSYAELQERSNRLCNILKNKGVTTEMMVPVCMDRSPDLLIAILAIMKAGGAYVPMDPAYPQARINYILKDTNAQFVICDSTGSKKIKACDPVEIILAADALEVFTAKDVEPPLPSHLAYVIYTSGSTGTPKGVMITHAALHHFLCAAKEALSIDAQTRLLAITTYCFDIAYLEFFLPLTAGGTVIMAGNDKTRDAFSLAQQLRHHKPSHMQATPATWQMLTDSGWRNEENITILTGGEAISEELRDKLLQTTNLPVWNLYGPTEATIWAAFKALEPGEKVSIGRPLPGTQIYILDKQGLPLPQGIPGEICIGGTQVARGYLNLPELTAEKFITHPSDKNIRLYRTGDTGKWLSNGDILCLGRTDDQLKIRGYRIEPGEIEQVLLTSSMVKQAVVAGKTDSSGHNRLVAYIVPEGAFEREELLDFLQKRLPEYMIPSMLLQLEQMPLTANGKINKKALQAWDISALQTTEYVAPRNALETTLAVIWEELLEVEKVGVYDNFFALGGHSLLAVRLLSGIRKAIGKEIAIKDLFSHPTIALLGELVSTVTMEVRLPAITAGKRPARIPLSYSQERLWFIDQLQGSVAYHIPYCCRVTGVLDLNALEQSFRAIIQRHEVLRTVMIATDGTAYQTILPADAWTLSFTNAAGNINELFTTPFSLDKDYMLKVGVISKSVTEHLLYIVLHHIAGDAWSIDILLKELSLLYRHLHSGTVPSLAVLPVQYADFAAWQRKNVAGARLNTRLAYWQRQLQDVTPLALYTDFTRPAVPGHQSGVVSVLLDVELQQQLLMLSQKEGVTLFMTMLSAFKTLLHHYTGQQDICIGSPVAGRQQSAVEGLIGFFVNTLALRSNVQGDDTFIQLLQQVKQTTLDAYEYQDVPYEKIVEVLGVERDMDRNPIFQVMFLLQQSSAMEAPELDGLVVETVDNGNGYTEKFDLTIGAAVTEQGLAINISYATELFTAATITRMLQHYEQILRAIALDPHTKIGKVQLLSEPETIQLLSFNGDVTAYPSEKSIGELFEIHALLTPGATAIIFENDSLTYQELDEHSNRLAHYLVAAGVHAGMPVAICMDKSPALITGILAILKAGGAYVPIDKDYPQERMRFILTDTRAGIMLTDTATRKLLPALDGVITIATDESREQIMQHPHTSLSHTVANPQLAYIMYTSGSTGFPKGVMVEHGNVVSLVKDAGYVDFHTQQVLLSTGAISFDATTFEYWGMLLNGGTLVLCRQQQLLDANYLKAQISAHGVNIMWFTAGWCNQLIDADISLFEGLQTILVGGEKLSETHISRLQTAWPQLQVINGYGPTENTTFSLTHHISTSTLSIPIGKPLHNREAYVLNSYGGLAPLGVPGEIYLGGAGVTKGYLHQPALTAEKFIPHPFRQEQGARLYRTGDIGRWLPDGSMAYLGRIDDQLKLNGYRIEPGEIESVAMQSGLLEQVVVMPFTQASTGNKQLIGYAASKAGVDKASLVAWLQARLPSYMVPQHWVVMPEMPLNNNGKIDKHRLPAPEITGSAAHYMAARNATEEALVFIWQELLGVERIGIHDNFFFLGGHSLLAVRVISAIRKTLEKELRVKDLFYHPTIAGLSAILLESAASMDLPPVMPVDRTGRLPLSYSQERLRFIDQLEGSSAYHITFCCQLDGLLDIHSLEQSFAGIVNRHEILRTVMVSENGKEYQQVLAPGKWKMQVVQETEIHDKRAFVRATLTAPFVLEKDPVLRVTVIAASPEAHTLLVVLHHIAGDGWSIGLLLEELSLSYMAIRKGDASSLPALPVQYGDYASWQRRHLDGAALDKGLAYWQQQLAGVTPLDLFTDYARPVLPDYSGGMVHASVNAALHEQLKAIASEQGATLFMTILAAFKVLLYRYTGQHDISIGTPVAGRSQAAIENLIGCFVNTLVLRSHIEGHNDFIEVLQQVKQTCLEAYEHQDIPFEKVVAVTESARDTSRHPLFQVMFILQNTSGKKALELEAVTTSELYNGDGHTEKFDMTVALGETPEGLQISVSYNRALYRGESINALLESYLLLLQEVADKNHTAVNSLELLSSETKTLLLHTFNDTEKVYPSGNIVSMFERQATMRPDKTALLDEDASLTYRELNERSNRLAHYLLQNGVRPLQLVAVCMQRQPDMIVAMLAILKAGGAYVPLDPAYPQERLRYMLEDTAASLVLTDEESSAYLPGAGSFSQLVVSRIALDSYPVTSLAVEVLPAQLAYMIYTSGSTGKPKGVMVSHGNAANFIQWCQDEFSPASFDILYAVTAISFDLSVFECFYPLSIGKTIRLLDNGLSIPQYLSRDANVFVNTVPSVVSTLLQGDMNWNKISVLNMAGEPVPLHVQQALDVQAMEVRNLYGPSETTTYSTCYRLQQGIGLSIGKPIANTKIYIIDAAGNLLPPGVPGELCIGGAGVASGYLHQPNLTKQKFVPDPFSNTNGARMYRTGDRGRWLPDGNITYLGRNDEQVKLHGYRIELGEIEKVAIASGLMTQAVVTLTAENDITKKQLVGYGVASQPIDHTALVSYLRGHLPEYMIPRLWMTLDVLPLNSNGKIDRQRLPAPEATIEKVITQSVVMNDTEARLAAIWCDLLEITEVGIHDDFFEKGGHSLLGGRMVSAVRKTFGKELAIKDLFSNPTIAQLSVLIGVADTGVQLPPVLAYDDVALIPLSYGQERLWFIDKLQGSVSYHIPFSCRFIGELDIPALEASFREIIQRHAALRTVMLQGEEEAIQYINDGKDWALLYKDANEIENIDHYISGILNKPFSLEKECMLRVGLVKLAPQEHIFFMVLHHIAGDAWSISILLEELSQLYRHISKGSYPSLPLLPVQYKDFAIWQRRHIAGTLLATRLGYWKQKLSGVAPLALFTDYTRPAILSSRGGIAGKMLEPSLHAQLIALSQQEGVTLFMTILAAFKILLYRYTGQHDICVGSPVAGRQRAEIEGLIGLFVNTLALRSNIGGKASFREILQQVKQTTLEAYEHQDVPYEKIVEALAVERDMSRNPIFQVMLVLENTSGRKQLELEGITIAPVQAGEILTEKFDITVGMAETPDGLYLKISYCKDLYRQETIGQLMAHYENVLRAVVANRDVLADELEFLTPAANTLLLHELNNTEALYPPDNIVSMFTRQAVLHPDNIALLHKTTSLTYRELDERSNRLAHYLLQNGVQPLQLVAICMQRNPDLIVSIIAVLKTGAAYVPLDPAYPQERLRYMLEETGAALVLTDKESSASLPASLHCCTILVADITLTSYPATALPLVITSTQLAYLIYTSGSTGKPKGVMILHSSVANFIQWCQHEFDASSFEVLYAVTAVCFDLSVFECWYPLSTGKTIRLLDNGLSIPEYLEIDDKVFINTVPSVVSTLLQNNMDWHKVKVLNMAGEPVPLHVQQALDVNGMQVRNLYGPSETTTYSTCYRLEQHRPLSIGRPVGNTKIYITDPVGNLLPPGVPGELCIGGAGVAMGYFQQPALSAEKFIADPFSNIPGACMYRTGDRGRWLPDGNIEYLGRNDEQVKVHGYRIEPGEIEQVALQSKLVTQVVVVLRPGFAGGDAQLVAYTIATEQLNKEALIAYMRERLPDYMVPALWIALNEWPLNANGKIDKQRLPSPDETMHSIGYEAPRTAGEQQLAALWSILLGISQVGRNDHFFERGGHSLKAVRLAGMIAKTWGISIALKDIFFHPTLAAMARFLEHTSARESYSSIPLSPASEHYPLTAGQMQLWLLDELHAGSSAYNVPVLLKLSGHLDVKRLQLAFHRLVKKHESLRTVFRLVHGAPRQFILENESAWPALEVLDYQDLPDAWEAALQTANELAGYNFHLGTGPLMQARLINAGNAHYLLAINIHHIITDSWSVDIMAQELGNFYEMLGHTPSFVPASLPLQYKDYAYWMSSAAQQNEKEQQRLFWLSRFSDGVPVLQLFADHARTDVSSFRGHSMQLVFDEQESGILRAVAQRMQISLFPVLMTMIKTLLYRYANQDDLVLGVPVSCRTHPDLEQQIGYYLNTLAVRSRLQPGKSFGDNLQLVNANVTAAMEHSTYPYDELVEAISQTQSLPGKGLFNVLVSLDRRLTDTAFAGLENITVATLPVVGVTAKFDLSFLFTDTDKSILCNIEYSEIFDPATIAYLAAGLKQLLLFVAGAGNTPIREFELLQQFPATDKGLIDFNFG